MEIENWKIERQAELQREFVKGIAYRMRRDKPDRYDDTNIFLDNDIFDAIESLKTEHELDYIVIRDIKKRNKT